MNAVRGDWVHGLKTLVWKLAYQKCTLVCKIARATQANVHVMLAPNGDFQSYRVAKSESKCVSAAAEVSYIMKED